MGAHHAEAFLEDSFVGDSDIGWQCLTPGCGAEVRGFRSLAEAQAGADEHEEATS